MRGLIEQELTEKTEEIAVLVTSALFVHKESAVHPLYSQSSAMTSDVIGAAIDVHRDKGPGLLESIYEWCLTMELELRRAIMCKRKRKSPFGISSSLAKNRSWIRLAI